MFCQWFTQKRGTNPSFPAFVIFTDEAQFTRDGIQNFHNQHLWEDKNPHSSLASQHITLPTVVLRQHLGRYFW
jgi:hypothetical protein